MADIAWSALYSLKVIDQWMNNIQESIANVGVVGYKAKRTSLDGKITDVISAPSIGLPGVQFGESNLNLARTYNDFASPGEFVASGNNTDFGIQPLSPKLSMVGFFYLWDENGNEYYTRDGEFHWDNAGYLRNEEGLYVVKDGAAIPPPPLPIDDLNLINIRDDIATDGSVRLDHMNMMVTPTPNDALIYSRFGTNIYTATGDGVVSYVPPDAMGNIYDPTNTLVAKLYPNTLEQSNADLRVLLPELELSKKMYEIMAKLLQTEYSETDGILNILK